MRRRTVLKGLASALLAGQFEDYPGRGSPIRAHELASGTKSFCGVMAVAAVQDGLLSLEEPLAQTLTE